MRRTMSRVSRAATLPAVIVALALGLLPRPAAATAAEDQKAWEDLVKAAAAAGRQPPPGPTAGSCGGLSLLGVCSGMAVGPTALSMRVASAPVQTAIDQEQSTKSEVESVERRAKEGKDQLQRATQEMTELEARKAAIIKDPNISKEDRAGLIGTVDNDIAAAKEALGRLTKQAAADAAVLAAAQAKHAEAVQALKVANSQPGAWGAAR